MFLSQYLDDSEGVLEFAWVISTLIMETLRIRKGTVKLHSAVFIVSQRCQILHSVEFLLFLAWKFLQTQLIEVTALHVMALHVAYEAPDDLPSPPHARSVQTTMYDTSNTRPHSLSH